MPTYAKAPADVDRLIASIKEKFHGPLHGAGVTVDALMASPTTGENGESSGPPLKKNGYPCAALVRVNSLKLRVQGHADAEITFDAERWEQLKPEQRAALIDHELEHLTVVKDKDGVTKTDDLDRPRLRIKAHDREVGWFNDVVRRHGKNAMEYMGFDAIWQGLRQLNLPGFDAIG